MTGQWTHAPLTGDEGNAESHWMRQVMGRRGRLWCSVRLSRKMAELFCQALTDRYIGQSVPCADSGVAQPVEDLIKKGGRISQSGFSVLREFCCQEGDDCIETELLLDEEAESALKALSSLDGFDVTDLSSAPAPFSDSGCRLAIPDQEQSKLDGDEVIVAIIDDGIGIANQRFRLSPTETRIQYFLDMNQPASCDGQAAADGATQETQCPVADAIGTMWTKAEIDQHLAQNPNDEDAIYRAMGMIDSRSGRRQPLKFSMTHGTHVLDIATGYDHRKSTELEQARKRPIIAVQLPSDVVIDRSGSEMSMSLKQALEWVGQAARELSERTPTSGGTKKYLPLVLNFSFGIFAGPHDGLGEVEKRIRAFIQSYRRLPGNPHCYVVLPAGNSLQARSVACLNKLKKGETVTIPWRVKPDDKTSSFVQIWLPTGPRRKAEQVTVSLIPPRGGPGQEASSRLDHKLDWAVGKTTFARIYHQWVPRAEGQGRERVTIAIRPTEADSAETAVCPAGLWQIRVTNKSLPKGAEIDLRIQRDDPVSFELRTGRQSYFDDPDYVRFDPDTGRPRNDESLDQGRVRRRGTLNAYATGEEPVVVGGYRHSDGGPALYSSAGPATSERSGPTLAAVCEESPSHRGVIATGTYSGATAVMNGTSVAAPMVTRRLADAMSDHAFQGDPCRSCKTLREVLKEVKEQESSGICGPHGRYSRCREARHGVGRLIASEVPSYRRRIDHGSPC